MYKKNQLPTKVHDIIRSFKVALKRHYNNFQYKRRHKNFEYSGYYQEAKRAQTQERNLLKALELYTKAIQNGQKKDSSIKDFASSLHQLGHTVEAVRLMDDCQGFYDGNKEKYLRLRDNLQIQINPTGKHLCRYILIENTSQEVKRAKSDQQVMSLLFKSPKRIKKLIFVRNFDLSDLQQQCERAFADNILVEFQSFSAAKKTLESFNFDQWFSSNLYWVNYKTMRIICSAFDGKKDFEQGFVLSDDLIEEQIFFGKESFWTSFGEKIYSSRSSNGFINLLATHLIKQYLSEIDRYSQNKENIFESSKISQQVERTMIYFENSLQDSNNSKRNVPTGKERCHQSENNRREIKYKNNWYQ